MIPSKEARIPDKEHRRSSGVVRCRAGQGMTSPSAALEVALDAMCSMQAPFYHRYELFSAVERRGGGQGMVQFAKILNTSEQVCIPLSLSQHPSITKTTVMA